MEVKIKLINPKCMPVRMSTQAAGYDVFTSKRKYMRKGRNLVPLGFALEMPPNMWAEIRPRSSFSLHGFLSRKGHVNADSLLGTIDADYRGEVNAIVYARQTFIIEENTRIAQIVFHQLPETNLTLVDELSDTLRGNKGFGSTGTNHKQ